jgi:heat shock protein beta
MRFRSLISYLALGAVFLGVVANEKPEEKFQFQAEVGRVLDIVVNSLYQNKDVFLRELISNASDALDKIRFLSITNPDVLGDKSELEIRVSYDNDAKTLTITDSGIGMSKEDLVSNLGTVARSGTTNFVNALKEGSADISQIGMFGVGFYSAYLVAEKVTVASKNPSSEEQYIWISGNGDDSFTVGVDPRGNTLGRGTEITLYLKEDAEEYADFDRLSAMVRHYSEFITHPIYLRKTETVEVPEEDESDAVNESDELDISEDESTSETATKQMKTVTTHSWVKSNADAAIWNRPKEDITDDEYQEFFKLIAKDNYGNATAWSHFDAEGNINFKSLIYMPEEPSNSFLMGDVSKFSNSMKLYVRKVLISDDFELLPQYMSFITGVVDSDDLPLNVNRETLQESKIISIIRKKVVRKVIDMLKKVADEPMPEEETDADGNPTSGEPKEHQYLTWYKKFSPSIKMGITEDEPNRKRLSKLVRVQTSKSGDNWISFDDYVSNMKEWQKNIYYIAGLDKNELEKSAFMEKFIEKDLEVIYFTEPADEYMISHLREFDGNKFVTITNEAIEFEDEDKDLKKRRSAAYNEKYKGLIKFMNKFYGKAITKTKISSRLGNAPAIVSSSEYGHTANMERIMKAQAFAHGAREMQMQSIKTLEINPRHPFINALLAQVPPEIEDNEFEWSPEKIKELVPIETRDALWNLLDTALLNGGYPISEGKAFSMRMLRSIKRNLNVESVELLEEINPPVEEDVAPEIDIDSGGINMDDFEFEDSDAGPSKDDEL